MKVLLYFEGQNVISKSGIGRAFSHQQKALTSAGIEYTTDPWDDTYDILHINTSVPRSSIMPTVRKKISGTALLCQMW